MNPVEENYYKCRSEIHQRARDINRAIDKIREYVADGRDPGFIYDELASISHHTEMMWFSFEAADKEIADDLEQRFKDSREQIIETNSLRRTA